MNTVYFDLETTSAEKDTCRIIQLAIKQVDEDGKVLISKSKLYKPDTPISPSATAVHGITNEMVEGCPSFYDDCKKLKKVFENAVLIGYNLLIFDIPVLLYEFDRAGVQLNLSKKVIDVLKLETILSPKTLSAVYERYTGKKLEGAHGALADVLGTETVLAYQKAKITKDNLNEDELLESVGIPKDAADFFGKLKYDEEGDLIFNFGKKCFGKKVKDERDYSNWVLNEKFPLQIKTLIREEWKKVTKQQFTKPQGFYPSNKKLLNNDGLF